MLTSSLDTRDADIEAEVRANILAQPVGSATLADLALPDSLLAHIIDRVICSSFEERHRIVTAPVVATTPPPAFAPLVTPTSLTPGPHSVTRIDVAPLPTDPLDDCPEARPGSRAFAPPITLSLGVVASLPPSLAPLPPELQSIAHHIAVHLATDGLLHTLAFVLTSLSQSNFIDPTPDHLLQLASIGFPVDLLAHFTTPQRADPLSPVSSIDSRALATIRHVARRLAPQSHTPPTSDQLDFGLLFRFSPTNPAIFYPDDAGSHTPALLRAQMTRAGHYLGPNSGDNLDLLRHVAQALPDIPILVNIQAGFADEFIARARSWARSEHAPVTVLAHACVVSQWAQDNARAGFVELRPDIDVKASASRRFAVLSPRFPSRGDDGSVFIPTEAAVVRSLARADLVVVQSPLLFQGGNLLLSPDPRHPPNRLLLLGEAEVARNVSLGFSRTQAIEALAIEFGAGRAVVLPAVSYHIDYEISLRAISPTDVVAFVLDVPKATIIVLECALSAIERARLLPKPRLKAARHYLASSRWIELLELFFSAVIPQGVGSDGHLTESFARHFALSPGDHPAGNLYRVLLALDVVSSWIQTPWESSMPPHAQAYLRALRRNHAARNQMHEQLRSEGFRVVTVPGIAHADRSMCPLNGVQTRSKYLISGSCGGGDVGGLFEPLDAAANRVISAHMSNEAATVVIPTAESQRRNGAIHCTFSAS